MITHGLRVCGWLTILPNPSQLLPARRCTGYASFSAELLASLSALFFPPTKSRYPTPIPPRTASAAHFACHHGLLSWQTIFDRRACAMECLFADITGYPRGNWLMPATLLCTGAGAGVSACHSRRSASRASIRTTPSSRQRPDVRLVPTCPRLRPVPWSAVPRYVAVHDCVELDR